MERLYVLYDSRCGLCSWAKRWLLRQPAFLDLKFIPAGSPLAARLFPGLSRPGDPPEELVVVSDQGGVYRDASAWIMCLFALEEYREWAGRLTHPLLRPLGPPGVLAAVAPASEDLAMVVAGQRGRDRPGHLPGHRAPVHAPATRSWPVGAVSRTRQPAPLGQS